jgi:hypothetical protein
MPKNRFDVSLNARQRRALRRIANSDNAPAFKVRNARVLLRTDAFKGDEDQADKTIAKEFKLSVAAIERIQQRFVERGLDVAINQRPGVQDIVVNAAPDQGTFVDFGTGKVVVNPDGSTSVTYPGGAVNVGLNGVIDALTSGGGVNVNSGIIDVTFPGGGVFFDPVKGLSITYPGGGVFFNSTEGLVVKSLGQEFRYPLDNGFFAFPGGFVNVGADGTTSVQFPGGSVNVGASGVTVNTDSVNVSV